LRGPACNARRPLSVVIGKRPRLFPVARLSDFSYSTQVALGGAYRTAVGQNPNGRTPTAPQGGPFSPLLLFFECLDYSSQSSSSSPMHYPNSPLQWTTAAYSDASPTLQRPSLGVTIETTVVRWLSRKARTALRRAELPCCLLHLRSFVMHFSLGKRSAGYLGVLHQCSPSLFFPSACPPSTAVPISNGAGLPSSYWRVSATRNPVLRSRHKSRRKGSGPVPDDLSYAISLQLRRASRALRNVGRAAKNGPCCDVK